MPNPAVGMIGATFASSIMGANAAEDAAAAQSAGALAEVGERRRQFDKIQELFKPYIEAGTLGLGGYKDLIGLGTPEAETTAIRRLETSPTFAALQRQGEEAILQNASATGGLRGGNVQAALGQFRPALLSGLIDQQLTRLGNLTSLGQSSAAGVGNAGLQTGSGISDALRMQAAAQAGGILGQQRSYATGLRDIGGILGGASSGSGGTTGGWEVIPSGGLPGPFESSSSFF